MGFWDAARRLLFSGFVAAEARLDAPISIAVFHFRGRFGVGFLPFFLLPKPVFLLSDSLFACRISVFLTTNRVGIGRLLFFEPVPTVAFSPFLKRKQPVLGCKNVNIGLPHSIKRPARGGIVFYFACLMDENAATERQSSGNAIFLSGKANRGFVV